MRPWTTTVYQAVLVSNGPLAVALQQIRKKMERFPEFHNQGIDPVSEHTCEVIAQT